MLPVGGGKNTLVNNIIVINKCMWAAVIKNQNGPQQAITIKSYSQSDIQ
jgi:hypothetical protein